MNTQPIIDMMRAIETSAPLVWRGLVNAARAESLVWVLFHLFGLVSCALASWTAVKLFFMAKAVRAETIEKIREAALEVKKYNDSKAYSSSHLHLPDLDYAGAVHLAFSVLFAAYSITMSWFVTQSLPLHVGNLAYPERLAAMRLVDYFKKGKAP